MPVETTYCRFICDVEIGPLVEWMAANAHGMWPSPSAPNKPQRIQGSDFPKDVFAETIAEVMEHFPTGIPDAPMLSRVLPGQSHAMHVDSQRADWATRIHLPLVTNPGCWVAWEDGPRFSLGLGKAYTFDTLSRHAFGNDGNCERIHLVFDVRAS